MIVTRYNFETNSSSMHSLSFRKSEGMYSDDELKYSEELRGTKYSDAIVVLKTSHVNTNVKEDHDMWLFSNKLNIRDYEMDFIYSPMQVLATFRGKLTYMIATLRGYRYNGWKSKYEEAVRVCHKALPGVEINIDSWDDDDDRWGRGGTDSYLLFQFLKEKNVTIEQFLTDDKYIVIVNYTEYQKMRRLNMVDEDEIDYVYHKAKDNEFKLMFDENGIWHLHEADLEFGRSPFRVLGTPEGKARYALAANCSTNLDEVLHILQKVYPDLKKIELPLNDPEWYDEKYMTGYCEDNAIPSGIPLEEFILNKKYVIISDGDEYCIWDEFKKTKLFNHKEYPKEPDDERE